MPDDMKPESKDTALGLIEAGIEFWFNDNEKVRSPIPKEIQPQVRAAAVAEYDLWLANLTPSGSIISII